MNLEGYRRDYSFYRYSCIIHMLAIELHKDQKDKSGEPYILHIERVAEKLPEDSLEYLVALLHDTVEDTGFMVKSFTRNLRESLRRNWRKTNEIRLD